MKAGLLEWMFIALQIPLPIESVLVIKDIITHVGIGTGMAQEREEPVQSSSAIQPATSISELSC